MKTVGIIAAMSEELQHFSAHMQLESQNKNFYKGKLFDVNVILAVSGIGKVNAAACTQMLIDTYKINYLINIGVAGAINNELKIGDIIAAKNLVQHDFDATAFNLQLGEIPRLQKKFFNCDKKILDIIKSFAAGKNLANKIHFGTISTGDKFVSNDSDKKFIEKNFQAHCTEMEGAAIAQVCFLNEIPFTAIRIISDKSNNDAVASYKKFMSDATKNLFELVKFIISTH